MSNCGSAVVKSDGIACLLRRFETHLDTSAVFTRLPEKAYRPGSVRGHKIIALPALEPINRSNPLMPIPNGSKLIVNSSSSKSMESPVLSSPTSAINLSELVFAGEMKVDGKCGASSQQAATGEEKAAVHSTNSMDDHEPEKTPASSSSTQTSSSSDQSKEDSISTPPTPEANLNSATENHGRVQLFRSSEDGSAASDPCKVPIGSSKNSGSTNELDAADRKAARAREAGIASVATRFIFKQSSRENQNVTVYLDDTSSSSSSSSSLPNTSNKVKQLARSMDNLCSSNSAASTPTKDRNVCHSDKSTRVQGKWNDSSPSTASAAIPSPMANDEKVAAARAKKPPPVPKKNPKVSREAADGRQLNYSASGDQSGAKPQAAGERSQTMPNLDQVKKPAARPTTLFPNHQGADNDGGGHGDENDEDAYRHKSLPILGNAKDDDDGRDEQQLLPTNAAPKNTLFPCNRQKTRTRILSTETNSTTGDQDLPFSPFVTSPMSLGTRTPPDIDSLVVDKNFSDKKFASEQQSTTAGNNAFTRSRSSDQLLFVDDVFHSHEAFDPDSFLSEAFDFLGVSNSAESETKASPLKSWTDTWRRGSQKRLSYKASDKSSEVAGSSREYRPTEGHRKEEPTGNLPDKTEPQDEKAAKTKPVNLLNVGPSKTSYAPVKSSSRDEKTKAGEEAEPPTHFGVVLRRTDTPSTLFRRSSIASLVSKESPSAPPKKANARHESFVSRPVTKGTTAESFRTSDRTSVILNRKPSVVSAGTSALPLTVAVPSQKPAHKYLFGRNIVSRASSTLNRTSAGGSPAAEVQVGARGARQSATSSGNKLESEWNDIDRAFMFLESS